MKTKAVLGSTMAVGLLSLGILAGRVVRGGSVAAQTPAQATATAVPSTPATPGTGVTKDPLFEGRGGPGGRHGGGMGGAGLGQNATSDGATRAISASASGIEVNFTGGEPTATLLRIMLYSP